MASVVGTTIGHGQACEIRSQALERVEDVEGVLAQDVVVLRRVAALVGRGCQDRVQDSARGLVVLTSGTATSTRDMPTVE